MRTELNVREIHKYRRLREFEEYWMIKLQTLEPYGMNGINEYQRIIATNGLHRMFEM